MSLKVHTTWAVHRPARLTLFTQLPDQQISHHLLRSKASRTRVTYAGHRPARLTPLTQLTDKKATQLLLWSHGNRTHTICSGHRPTGLARHTKVTDMQDSCDLLRSQTSRTYTTYSGHWSAGLALLNQVTSNQCAGSCEPGSRCRPNECIFGGEKPRGVGILELGVYEQGKGNGEFGLQAIGDRGERILS
jgi:hypothetical protein